MARRKNVKRIDPKYFLHETVNRNDDGSAMEEGCPHEEGGEAIDISVPGAEVHVDDISQLSPEEAFAAGMAAARDAIDQAMGAPAGPPPDELEEIVSDEEVEKATLQSAGWEPEGGEEALAWRDKLRGKK